MLASMPRFPLWIGVMLVFFVLTPTSADIYRFRDKNGVWHFTNIKRDRRYRLYIRTDRKLAQYLADYGSIIRQASEKFKVEPSLIKAVIKAESDFDHRAVSHKGARGLMQLMPNTAQDMDVGDPFDAEENIFGGTRYLSLLLDRYKNDKSLALAAYNAGPENVAAYRGVPPFEETQTFIERVLRYYDQYRSEAK